MLFVLLIPVFCFSQNPESFLTHFGTDFDDVGHCIIQNMVGDYSVIGQTESSINSSVDVYLVRTDTLAAPKWQKFYGGIGVDIGKSIVELNDSSFVIAGFTNSFGNGGYDAYFIRVDKKGNLIWQKTFGGINWDFANCVKKTSDGNLIICGSTYSFGNGDLNAFVLKLDLTGKIIWSKIYGGKNDDVFNKIIQTNDGGYMSVGTTKSHGDSLGDIWLMKFNSTGDSLTTIIRGGNKKDVGNAILQDSNGDFFVAGGSESYSNGKEDAYIFKLSPNFSLIWDRYYGMATEDEEVYDLLFSGSNYGQMLILYSSREVGGTGLNIKNVLLDGLGYYVRGGSWGSSNDDVGYSMCNTKDKGYISCGYTKGYSAILSDVLVVKYDSVMTIGPLVLVIDERQASSSEANVYPTIIENHCFYFNYSNFKDQTPIVITNLEGQTFEPIDFIRMNGNVIKCILPPELKGMVFVNIDNRKILKKCLIK